MPMHRVAWIPLSCVGLVQKDGGEEERGLGVPPLPNASSVPRLRPGLESTQLMRV